MSISTWLKEYYKTPKKSWNDKQCAEHSILKYEGSLSFNLKKHGIIKRKGDCFLEDSKSNVFWFQIDNCSFCKKYFSNKSDSSVCERCPLYLETKKNCGMKGSAYTKWVNNNNAKTMIVLMKKIISKCDESGKYNFKLNDTKI